MLEVLPLTTMTPKQLAQILHEVFFVPKNAAAYCFIHPIEHACVKEGYTVRKLVSLTRNLENRVRDRVGIIGSKVELQVEIEMHGLIQTLNENKKETNFA